MRNGDRCKSIFYYCREGASSDSMDSKEFSVGTFSFNEGINLIKFSILEEVKEVFLLYHMKIIPMAMVHMPVSTNRAKYEFWR